MKRPSNSAGLRKRSGLASGAVTRRVPGQNLSLSVLHQLLVLIRVEIVLVILHVLAAALYLYPGQKQAFVPVAGGLVSLLLLLLLAFPVLSLLRTENTVTLPASQVRALRGRTLLIALLSLLPGLLTLLLAQK